MCCQLNETINLSVKNIQDLYFVLRAYSNGGNYITKIIHCDIVAPSSQTGVLIFDLPANYPKTEELRNMLRSSTLGPSGTDLFESEIDFANDSTKIGAAVSGLDCKEFYWALVTDPNIDKMHCEDKDIRCLVLQKVFAIVLLLLLLVL